MKLPDFISAAPFNRLRKKMGAQLLEDWRTGYQWRSINPEELKRLAIKGIEVELDDIEFADDGTFEYRGIKVLVYIRDVKIYSRYGENLPKFHVSWCQTLSRKQNDGSYKKRYVVTTRTDGLFVINKDYVDKGILEENNEAELSVCKNCLQKLNYKNYSASKKQDIVANFSIKEFFEEYGGTKIPGRKTPTHNERTAPLDAYPDDWKKISKKYRAHVDWICEDCNVDFSSKPHLLHVHHRNHNRADNKWLNLKALCVKCHAKRHDHMKNIGPFD